MLNYLSSAPENLTLAATYSPRLRLSRPSQLGWSEVFTESVMRGTALSVQQIRGEPCSQQLLFGRIVSEGQGPLVGSTRRRMITQCG